MGLLDRLRGRPAVTASEIRAYFNRAAEDEEHYPSTIDPRIWHVKLVLEQLETCLGAASSGKRIADIGCGKGRFARIVKERIHVALRYRRHILVNRETNTTRIRAADT